MIEDISAAEQTLFSDLKQKCLDIMFDNQLPENGSFVKRVQKNREYWYYNGYIVGAGNADGKKYSKYVGPADDSEITKQVENFKRNKWLYADRQKTIKALHLMGMAMPTSVVGNVVEALWKEGQLYTSRTMKI